MPDAPSPTPDGSAARRPLGIPRLEVRTPRLALRPLVVSDAEAMASYRSLPDVCRYIPPEPMAAGEIRGRIEERWGGRELQRDGDFLFLGVLADGRLVGDVMLALRSVEDRGGEVGWIVHPAHGGRGLATEAAHAVLHLAFDDVGLHRVVARVDVRNEPSVRLAERLGMRREAHLLRNEWFKGEWSDELDFALLDTEFAGQHDRGDPSVSRWCPVP